MSRITEKDDLHKEQYTAATILAETQFAEWCLKNGQVKIAESAMARCMEKAKTLLEWLTIDDGGNTMQMSYNYQNQKRKHGKVYAVEFDGTIVSDKYPKIGEPNEEVLAWIRKAMQNDCTFILTTKRQGKALKQALEWCRENGIAPDVLNSNPYWIVRKLKYNPRQIIADVYVNAKNAGGLVLPEIEIKEKKNGKPKCN